jgi:hypothetical protein
MIPVAMAFVAVGMSILVIGIVWPHFSPSLSVPHPATDWNDFFRGPMFGIAIAMEITGVVIAMVAAAAAKKRKPL